MLTSSLAKPLVNDPSHVHLIWRCLDLGQRHTEIKQLAGYCRKNRRMRNRPKHRNIQQTVSTLLGPWIQYDSIVGPASWRKFGELSVLHFFVLTGVPSKKGWTIKADTDWGYLLKWNEIHVPECSITPLPCLLCDFFWYIMISLHVKGQNNNLHAKYITVCSSVSPLRKP